MTGVKCCVVLQGNGFAHIRVRRRCFQPIWANGISNSSYNLLIFFFLVNCAYSPLLSYPPVPRAHAPHQNWKPCKKQGLKLLFSGSDFMLSRKRELGDELEGHACQRMKCDEPQSFIDMLRRSWLQQLAWCLPNPVFLGWEFDPVCSVRNDTYLLDARA